MSDTARALTPNLLVRLRRLGPFDVSPDGRWLVTAMSELSDDGKTNDTNLYRLDLKDPDAGLVALTRSSRKKSTPRFAPDGTLGFLAEPDPGRRRGQEGEEPEDERKRGDEETEPLQLHRLSLDGGEAECLTDLARGVNDFRWLPGGRGVVMLAPVSPEAADLEDDRRLHREWKDRKPSGVVFDGYPLRYWDRWHGPAYPHVVVAGPDGSDPRDLTPGTGLLFEEVAFDVSPDGKTLYIDIRDMDEDLRFRSDVITIDLASGERAAVTSGETHYWFPRVSPDGTKLACLRHHEEPRVTGKRDLAVVDLASGDIEVLTSRVDRWPDQVQWLDDDRLLYACDEGGVHAIHLIDRTSGEDRVLLADGSVGELRADRDRADLFFLQHRFTHPAKLCRLPARGGVPQVLADPNAELLEGVAMGPVTSHEVAGAEGTPVQLWEVLPPDFDPEQQYPLLLWIHGGPLHMYADEFHFRWNAQLFAARGYALILVNPRGSTGFGQRFIEEHNGNWGDHCYRDLMACVDEWEKKPYVDAGRTAALGASFGGFMVNWIAGHTDRFQCLVSHAGLYHLTAFWGTTDCGPEWESEFGGLPWENPELYEKWSPHHHAGNFKTPCLVTHGELDYRVPLADGLQMFQALQRAGVPSRFLYFPDENHWVLKPANVKLWNETVLEWLEEHLSGDEDAE